MSPDPGTAVTVAAGALAAGGAAGKLIDAVRSAIGTAYEPTAIRRKARAESDATLIRVEGAIAVAELPERASRRLGMTELRRQENIDAIVDKAIGELPETASSTPVDQDWMAQFFECSCDVSHEQMQRLWAKLLAGEVVKPGTFSRRTLTILRDMSPDDAEKFQRIARLVWTAGVAIIPRVAMDSEFFAEFQTSDGDLLDCEDAGLVNATGTVAMTLGSGALFFGGNRYDLIPPSATPPPGIPVYPLTAAGRELYRICEPTQSPDFAVRVVELFRSRGFQVNRVGQPPSVDTRA